MARDEYKQWRMAVFVRDRFSCQWCGATGVPLQADHIVPWIASVDLRYEISNGRTLCGPCHLKTATWGSKARHVVAIRKDGQPIFAVSGGADNVTIPTTGTGTATPVIATDDVSSVHFQKVKIDHGGDGATAPWTSAALADNTANPTIPGVAAFLLAFDGTNWDRVQATAGQLEVLLDNSTNNIGAVYSDILQVMYDGTLQNVKVASTSVSSSGDNTIVSGVASRLLTVLAWAVQAQGTVTVRWENGSGTNISAPWKLQDREGVVRGPAGSGHFYMQSASGQALVLNLSAAITVGVEVAYVEAL